MKSSSAANIDHRRHHQKCYDIASRQEAPSLDSQVSLANHKTKTYYSRHHYDMSHALVLPMPVFALLVFARFTPQPLCFTHTETQAAAAANINHTASLLLRCPASPATPLPCTMLKTPCHIHSRTNCTCTGGWHCRCCRGCPQHTAHPPTTLPLLAH